MVASEVELFEVFRLGEAAGESDIVREVGDRLAAQWLPVSRFREVQGSLPGHCGCSPARTRSLWAVWRRTTTGNLTGALDYYEQALPILREVGDRAGEAATLNNIGARARQPGGPAGRRSTTTSRRCPFAGRSGTGPVRRPR